jgi:hypothetical protein
MAVRKIAETIKNGPSLYKALFVWRYVDVCFESSKSRVYEPEHEVFYVFWCPPNHGATNLVGCSFKEFTRPMG